MAKTIKQRELNLLLAMDRSKAKKGISAQRIAVILGLFFVVLLLAAVAVLFFLKAAELSDRKDELTIYLNDPATQAAYDESIRANNRALAMRAQADAITGPVENLRTYPQFGSDGIRRVIMLAGTTVEVSNMNYDIATGVLSFSATCGSATRIPIFIAELRICGIFSDVDYSGYSGSTRTEAGEPTINEDGSETPNEITYKEFSFNVSCLVNAPLPDANEGAADENTDGEGSEGEAGA
jgi:hypothetical protein